MFVDGTSECKTAIVGVGGSGVGERVAVACAVSVGVVDIMDIGGVLEGAMPAGSTLWSVGRLQARITKIRMKLYTGMKLFFFMDSLLEAIIILFVIQINGKSGAYPSLARQAKFRHNSIHSENCEEK
jgi:hypothetical protein